MVKLRLPRKVVIIGSGVVVLCGASGAAALFIGRDKILGPSEETLAGVACTDVVRVAEMRKDRGPWLRKFVKVPPGTDGMTRVKTAIRVAQTIQQTLPADLIEIAVLDEAGPDQRAFMRGRALGAEVILVKDPSKVPGIDSKFTINYYEGGASGTGMFYGKGETMASKDAEALVGKMDKLTDCAPPVKKEDAAAADGKKPEGEKKAEGEKKPPKPKEKSKGGETKKEGAPTIELPNDALGRMQKVALDKVAEETQKEEEAKKAEEAKKPGIMKRMMGMVGLGGSGEEAAAPAGETKSDPKGEVKSDAKPAAEGESQPAADAAPTEPSKPAETAAAAPEESPSFMSKMMNMVGMGKKKPTDIVEHSSGPAIVSGKTTGEGEQPAADAKPAPDAAEAPKSDAHGG